jgi:hypothetical protein
MMAIKIIFLTVFVSNYWLCFISIFFTCHLCRFIVIADLTSAVNFITRLTDKVCKIVVWLPLVLSLFKADAKASNETKKFYKQTEHFLKCTTQQKEDGNENIFTFLVLVGISSATEVTICPIQKWLRLCK